MSLLIRGGTIVNHDHSRRADVLIKEGTIAAVGAAIAAPTGAEIIDAGGAYVIRGGIDPRTHLEMPFIGTATADDPESGTKAALTGGTTMVVEFCLPDPGQSMLAAYQEWRRKPEKAATDYGFHMAVTSWSKQIYDEMETVFETYGINTFKHFMAYKGALMVNAGRAADVHRQRPVRHKAARGDGAAAARAHPGRKACRRTSAPSSCPWSPTSGAGFRQAALRPAAASTGPSACPARKR